MIRLSLHALGALAVLLGLVWRGEAQTLQDPDFNNTYNLSLNAGTNQTPYAGGWTFGSTSGTANTKSIAGGQSGTALQLLNGPVFAEQAVTGLVAGNSYTVTFYIEDGGGGAANPGTISVFQGATLLGNFTNTSQTQWVQKTTTFTAQSTSDTLQFLNPTAGGSHINLDTIRVSVATPEPNSIYAASLLVAGVGWLERRRWRRWGALFRRA